MPGASFEWTGDDTLVVTASQSWINTFLKCPESARRELDKTKPRVVSDAMAIGTALHCVPEAMIGDKKDLATAIDLAWESFETQSLAPEFKWLQVRTMDTALKYISNMATSFERFVLPVIEDVVAIEHSIEQELWRGDLHGVYVILKMSGTPDIVTSSPLGFHIWDWKTANRPYEQWEVDRYYVQPTSYTFLVSEWLGEPPVDFTYCVFPKKPYVPEPQLLPTTRDAGDWAWLSFQLQRIVQLWLATAEGVVGWPLMDQGWHCSEKWCPVWSSCKGAHKESILTAS